MVLMNIPDCYGQGIYKYWKMKKDSIKFKTEEASYLCIKG